jgi:hypothetical protein
MAFRFFEVGDFYHLDLGVVNDLPNFIYPLIISISFFVSANFLNIIKLINSLLINATVFPMYWMLKDLIGARRAAAYSCLVFFVPSFGYATHVMPESLYCPIFVSAVWAAYALYTTQLRRYVWILGGLGALLFLTKPHALALLAAIPCSGALLWLACRWNDKSSPVRASLVLSSFVSLVISAALIVASTAVVRRESPFSHVLGGYTTVVTGTPVAAGPTFGSAALTNMLIHLSIVFFYFGIPLVASAVSFGEALRERRPKEAAFYMLVFGAAVFVLGMTFRFTCLVSPSEQFSRLHARYYFMLYPLMLAGFAVASESLPLGRGPRIVLVILGVISVTVLVALFIPRVVDVAPWGLVTDNLEATWFAMAPRWLIYVGLSSFLGLICYFCVATQPSARAYPTYFIVVACSASLFHMAAATQWHHGNVLRIATPNRQFVQAIIADPKAKVMLVDSSPMSRTNLPFWLHYDYTRVLQIPAGETLSASLVPTGTEWLVTLDTYTLELPHGRIRRAGACSIVSLAVGGEELRSHMSARYADGWTQRSFSLSMPEYRDCKGSLLLTFGEWQPAFPNTLTVRYADGASQEFALTHGLRTLTLPLSASYNFDLARSFIPRELGINSDERELGVRITSVVEKE